MSFFDDPKNPKLPGNPLFPQPEKAPNNPFEEVEKNQDLTEEEKKQAKEAFLNKLLGADKPKKYTAAGIDEALNEAGGGVGGFKDIINDLNQMDLSVIDSDKYGLKEYLDFDQILSKPIPYVGSLLFVEDVNTNVVEAPGGKPIDAFRRDIDNFWTSNNPDGSDFGLIKMPSSISNPLVPSQPAFTVYSKNSDADIIMMKSSPTLVEELQPGKLGNVKYENYDMTIPPETFVKVSKEKNNPAWFEKYLVDTFGLKFAPFYPDHNFKMETPNNSIASAHTHQGNFVQVKGNYNFLNRQYEESINDKSVDERLLPSLYTYMIALEENAKILSSNLEIDDLEGMGAAPPGANKVETVFFDHLTLNKEIEDFDLNIYKYLEPGANSVENETITEYFELWSQTIEKFVQEGNQIQELLDDFKAFVFSEASYEQVFKHNSAVTNFPMNVELNMSTDINKEFYNLLKQTETARMFAYDGLQQVTSEEVNFVETEGNGFTIAPPRTLYDFEEIINLAQTSAVTENDGYVFFGKPKTTWGNKFIDEALALALKSKVIDLVNTRSRTYEDILNGVPAYSETLFYEIQKYTSTVDGQLIDLKQTFFLPNDNEKILELVDTQVKYNKYYVYRIFAHKAIVGTKISYDFTPPPTQNDGPVPAGAGETPNSTTLTVRLEPSVKIARVPYYNVNETIPILGGLIGDTFLAGGEHLTTIILDNPPLPPQIEFLPIIGKPRDIIINIKDSKGSIENFSKSFGAIDAANHLAILKQQYKNEYNVIDEKLENVNLMNNKLFFLADEPALYFEVYQTPTKPETYAGFLESIYAVLDGPNNSIGLKLKFNEKRYFTFRTIDYHGNFSNLSEIYEVEIKESSGIAYPVIKVLDLEDEEERRIREKSVTSRSGKRFVMIKAAEQQIQLEEPVMTGWGDEGPMNTEPTAEDVVVPFGEQNNSVFNPKNKFKIRVKSKKTGKIVEINLRCKQKLDKIFY